MSNEARIDMRFLAVGMAATVTLVACGQPDEAAPANAVQVAGSNAAAPAVNKAAPVPKPGPPRTGPWSPSGYALNGTEPFWGGSLTGTTIRYMTPEDQFGDVVETIAAYAPDRETYSGAWRGRPFVLTLTRGPCTDGMSDRVYAFAAALVVAGGTRRGCADPQ